METLPFKNREVKIVYQPNPGMPGSDKPKGRFGVGVGALRKYVGDHNAETALQRAFECADDKLTVKLRKYGRIDFYFK
jgi:hypothetical protein